MKKRTISIMIALALVMSLTPAPAFAARTDLSDKSVYYTPASDYKSGDCILTASKMMIRRACIMNGTGDWSKISNKSLRSLATIFGLLRNSFTVDTQGLVFRVDSAGLTAKGAAAKTKEIAELLKLHPEGIVVHGEKAASTGPHGVLVTKVRDGIIYAADSTRNTGLNNKGIQPWKETTMLGVGRVNKYWYISSVSVSSKTKADKAAVKKAKSTLGIKNVRAPSKIKKGRTFSIAGTVRSNRKIEKVTVRVLDSKGKTKISASKKPGKKTFDLKVVDSKIKFGTLKKGKYTYQVIAEDTVCKRTLVNKHFTVK